uniref:TRPM SLOG domain-containing protein n=1 Tax=Chrysotila carterae TaxID=13221 RepID=A0A7S4BVR2_CHRCT
MGGAARIGVIEERIMSPARAAEQGARTWVKGVVMSPEPVKSRKLAREVSEVQDSGITLGSLRFSHRSRRMAKWARVPADFLPAYEEPDALEPGDATPLARLLFDVWKLTKPNVIISVTGGAKDFELKSAMLELEFQRGLVEAVQTTGAWTLTGGTDIGVMKLVGRTLRDVPNAVCIGIAPWGAVMEREGLASSALKYKVHQYVGDRGDGNKDDEFFALEPYHSHFILVDNHAIGKRSYGSEISFRVQMEEALCQDNEGNDEVIAVPKVLLVLGGGKGTFSNVLAALEEDRPVVVVPESEGAALSIYEVCCGTEDAQALFDSEPPTDDEQVMMRALLVEIAEINKQYKGLRDTAVCYWGLNDHWETEPLRDVILKSLLDDLKDQPCDAVRLAVTWKDSELVKGELEDLQINDKAGVVYAFTHALSLAETQVLQVLVDFKIRASQVRLNDLVLKEKEPGRLSQNIDELDHHNFLIVKDADASKLREEFKIDENSLYGFTCLYEKLDWYFGYGDYYLKARETQLPPDKTLTPSWTDLLLWSVLADCPSVAKILWTQVQDPLRVALMASLQAQQQAARLYGRQADELMEHAAEYESWATGLLNEAAKVEEDEIAILLQSVPIVKAVDTSGNNHVPVELERSSPSMRAREPNFSRLSTTSRATNSKDKSCSFWLWPDSPVELAVGGFDRDGNFHSCTQFLAHKSVVDFFNMAFDGYSFTSPWMKNEPDATTFDGDSDDDMDDSFFSVSRRELFFGVQGNDSENAENVEKQGKKRENEENVEKNLWLIGKVYLKQGKWASLFQVPKVKWQIHTLSALGYLMLVVFQLCGVGWPWEGNNELFKWGELQADSISPAEICNWVWAVARFLDETKQAYRQGKEGYEQTESFGLNGGLQYLRSSGNLLDLTHIFLVLIIAAFRIMAYYGYFDDTLRCFDAIGICGRSNTALVLGFCRCGYALVVVVVFSRFIDSFKCYRSFGLLYITMLNMIQDVTDWFKLVIFITIGFGVAFTVLLPGYSSSAQEYGEIYARPFFWPFWGLLGDFDVTEIYEYYSTVNQPEATVAVWLLFIYMFITTIVLVNLLIAQM